MKLATLRDGTRDGKLVVVSRDNKTFADARAIARTMQAALDQWDEVAPKLKTLFTERWATFPYTVKVQTMFFLVQFLGGVISQTMK